MGNVPSSSDVATRAPSDCISLGNHLKFGVLWVGLLGLGVRVSVALVHISLEGLGKGLILSPRA